MTSERTYPGEPTSVAAARSFAAAELADLPADHIDTIVLLVSELATNSVRHATSEFRVCIERAPDLIRVEVADAGGGVPTPRVAAPDEASGRGLQIVEALSHEWGVDELDPRGKSVWFTVALDGVSA